MGIVIRQSVKTSIVVLTGAILGALILWLSTKYVPQQQYGFINNLTKWAILISVMAPIGLNNTLAVFIHRYNDNSKKRKTLISLCLALPLFFLAIISVIYFIVPDWVIHHFQPEDEPLWKRYYLLLPIYTLLFVYMTILEQYLCSQMKVAISSFMREILLRVLNIILILLFGFDIIKFDFLVIGSVLVYFVPVVIFFIISFKTKGFGLLFDKSSFTKEEYKEIVHFSWYHNLLNISIILMGYLDSLLIPFYDHKGLSTLAVYTVAVYFISLVYMPTRAFLQASFSAFANAFAEKDTEKAKDIFVRSSLNLLIPTVAFAMIMYCNLDNAVAIIGKGKNYSGLIPVFMILLVGQMVNVATGMNDLVLSITNYYKFNFYVSLIISTILFLLLRNLIPRYGITGAAWASSITLILYNIIKFIFVWKKAGMQPFSFNTIKIIIAAIPAVIAGVYFPYFFNPDRHVYVHTFADAIMRSSTIIIIYILMLLWLKPSRDLEEYLSSVKKNKKMF